MAATAKLLQDDPPGASAPMGRREAGKAERRGRIIAAARELIRETGDAGLSMRALAARAGVSLATPYNLFGSKRAIVLALLHDVRAFQGRFSVQRSADPLERIFQALEIMIDYYVDDPAFYRALWAAVFDTSGEVRRAIYNDKRDAFWTGLVADAFAAGALCAEVDLLALQAQLDLHIRAVMLDWVLGETEVERLAATLVYGHALILGGAAQAEWRGPLRARLLAAQARLAGDG